MYAFGVPDRNNLSLSLLNDSPKFVGTSVTVSINILASDDVTELPELLHVWLTVAVAVAPLLLASALNLYPPCVIGQLSQSN